MGAHHGWRLFAAVFMTTLQKAQRSWRCRGFCGLVGLGWVHAKNMCMYIPAYNGSSDSTQLYTDVIRIPMILRCTLVQ